MASNYSTDLALELITTGEKAGLWGTITNTNLQILQQASSGYTAVAMGAGGDITLVLTDGAESNGKNLYFKLTGNLTANTTLVMPAATSGGTATRVFVVEDATVRTTSNYTLSVKTSSSTSPLAIPVGATQLVYSDGTDTFLGIQTKGYNSISDSNTPYTAVAGDQILVNTSNNPVTITLPATPSVGDEVVVIDAANFFGSNNCIIGNNGLNINGAASALTLNTNSQAITLVYANVARGWIYKTNTA
jgi:hypothetical protein